MKTTNRSDGFGTKYYFEKTDGTLTINRNYVLDLKSEFRHDDDLYHVTMTSESSGYLGVALSDEDMLDLFRAYLRMREEYETGEENGESI